MKLSQLEKYAPQARIDFIQAAAAKAAKLGISDGEIQEAKKSGEALIIAGKAFPAAIERERNAIIERVTKDGFDKVMEEAAYTWFNRFAVMRYMEVHGYIQEHDFSLFESEDGGADPEVVKHVADLNDWEELDFDRALDLKAENKTEELYRLIIKAQRQSLSKIMPFLFSSHSIEIEALLPDGLLLSDSIIQKMAAILSKENLEEVESLGWLYQFYISDKKNALMKSKKAYKTDEIPAVTQLFTPNWIVKYLTQNSIGRLWLSVHPSSPLKEKMEYYIEPAEQSDEVNKQLAEITPDSLEPEEITILDPACGSGHILIEAYNLLKAIYLEKGYEEREIPKLILKNNLFGLDIDDRAVQLARFALLMRARKDDKRLFRKGGIELNVHSIQETNGFKLADFTALGIDGVEELIATFQDAKTFGSLIEIPESLNKKLDSISSKLLEVSDGRSFDRGFSNAFDRGFAKLLLPLVNQAKVMARKYDAVAANPPYMKRKGMNPKLKKFISLNFKNSQSDLYATFIQCGFNYCDVNGTNSMITMDSWLYGESYSNFRNNILKNKSIFTLAQLGPRAFDQISGEVVQTACSIFYAKTIQNYRGTYFHLVSYNSSTEKQKALSKRKSKFIIEQEQFSVFPRRIIAFYANEKTKEVFKKGNPLKNISEAYTGLQTGNNDHFIKYWYEVSVEQIKFDYSNMDSFQKINKKWFPYIKGSDFRKWYGNQLSIVDWYKNGNAISRFRG